MERVRNTVGHGQLFCLLAASQCFWVLCWRPPLQNGLLTAGVYTAAAVPVFLFAAWVRAKPKKLPPVLRWGLWAVSVLYFVLTARQLLAVVNVLFSGMFEPLWILLILLLSVLAAAEMGAEPFCRAAFILYFLLMAGIAALILGGVHQYDVLNLTLPEVDAVLWRRELKAILPMQCEILMLAAFLPMSDRPCAKTSLLWVAAGWGSGCLLIITAALCLGEYATLCPYPIYEFSRVSGSFSASGLVPIYWMLLLTTAFLRLGGLLISAGRFASPLKKRRKLWVCLEMTAIFIVISVLHLRGTSINGLLAASGVALWVLLLLSLLFGKKGGTQCAKQRE